MNKQKKIEKAFSENLDRILAGRAVKTDAFADADMLSTLDFAAGIAKIKPAISQQFKTRLKAELLEKLEKQQTPAKKNIWYSLSLHQPVWQAVTAVFLVVLIISVIWRSGLFNISAAPPPTTTMTTYTTARPPATTSYTTTAATTSIQPVANLLSYNISTDKPAYRPGENVVINLTLKNISSQTMKMDKLPPILSIMSSDTGKPVYTFSAGKDTRSLAVGDSVQYSYSWDEADFSGRITAGKYYLELEDMEYQGQTLKFQQPNPVRFEITQ